MRDPILLPMREICGVQRALLTACVGVLAVGQAEAQWDLSSSVGLQTSFTQNANYVAAGQSDDTIAYLRLMGSALRTGARTRLNVSYAPNAAWFKELSDLNRVAHLATGRLEWNLGARSTLSFSENYYYTPEQGATANTFTSPVVLTSYSDRRFNTGAVNYRYRFSDLSDIQAELRYRIQTYSNPSLVDSRGPAASLRYHREVSRRVGLDLQGAYSRGRFDSQASPSGAVNPVDPNLPADPVRLFRTTDVANVGGGVRMAITQNTSASVIVGRSIVIPVEPSTPRRRAMRASASMDWTGRFIRARGGYNQGLSTGSGTFGISRTWSAHAGMAATLHARLVANLFANRTRSKAVQQSGARGVDTWTRGGFLAFSFTPTLSANAGMTRQTQESNRSNAPALGFNTYSVALQANFN